MNNSQSDMKMITKLLFRLLPFQILLGTVGAVNSFISGYFASNYVSILAMSSVGLYGPFIQLVSAVSTIYVGGIAIVSGKYLGRNQDEDLQGVFSLALALSALTAVLFTAVFLILSLFDLTGFLTDSIEVRRVFNQYLLGQAAAIIPYMLGNQLPAFLILENRKHRTLAASVTAVAANLALNVLFVRVMHLEALGLALSSSLAMWLFFLIEVQYFWSGKSHLRFSLRHLQWRESIEIFRTGSPGALTKGYQTLSGFLVNRLIMVYVGTVGVSAYAAANSLLSVFWAVPAGMLAVSRLMLSVSVGEEDRQTLTDVMRIMFRRFLPLMCAVSAVLILCAVPMTRIYYRDPSEPVYMMAVWGIRILPLAMPLSLICMHFVCYGQASGKHLLVHLESVLEGVVCVVAFSFLLLPVLGIHGVYFARVLNGAVCVLLFVVYAWIKAKHFPRTMDELMVIPEDFGVPESERLDLTVRTMEEVICVAEAIQVFFRERGVDGRRSFLAALSMEEMAGNIVAHGFTKDSKKHSIDIRAALKEDSVILRIRDDCLPFNPEERAQMTNEEDILSNIGIRMVIGIAEDVSYRNTMGLNVLTLRI